MKVALNVDAGEHDDEPEELYAIAHVVHIACGGHAGDEVSMDRVVTSCVAHGTRVGAHPSYIDREGFGRRAIEVAPNVLAAQLAEQCSALARVAARHGVSVDSAKPHGALYHAAHRDPEIARACVDGIGAALGRVAIVGLAGGELEAAARRAGHAYLREAFADRATRADGSLVPRDEPGALIEDPARAAVRAHELAGRGDVDTICVHGDTAGALTIARAVRHTLDASV